MRQTGAAAGRTDRGTMRAWRLIAAALILAAAAFEAWREMNSVFILVGLLLAAAYCAILPCLVRLALRLSGRRPPDRPV